MDPFYAWTRIEKEEKKTKYTYNVIIALIHYMPAKPFYC